MCPKRRPAASASSGGEGEKRPSVADHFKSTKKRPTSDPRVQLFWRLLSLLVVFCRLPFAIVENPLFKAFIWFLDATLPLPSRTKLTHTLLPALKAEGSKHVKSVLVGVRGVAITFDLWMSRKTEDNLSVDIHFIDKQWQWHHKHIGIISCKDSSTGEEIAPRIKTILEEYDLLYRVAAVVKDGGGNLATATVVLAKQGLTGCRALGAWVPHVTLCFAHKINGACNAAVLEAKRMNLEVSPPPPLLALHFVLS